MLIKTKTKNRMCVVAFVVCGLVYGNFMQKLAKRGNGDTGAGIFGECIAECCCHLECG